MTAALRCVLAASLALLAGSGTPPQEAPAAPQGPGAGASARAADVASEGAIVAALYDVISGGKEVARDWARFRSLFAPGARLVAVMKGRDGVRRALTMTPDEYVERSGPFLVAEGFFEREIAHRSEAFAHLVHRFSTYEGRLGTPDGPPKLRGINSIQLMNDGARWWVLTVAWEQEAPDHPLPPEYLPK